MPGVVVSASSGMEWAAHLGLPPVRALPPALGSPCAAPPCPRFVRRDPTIAPTSIFKLPAQQRFNLVVPTSLIERNFDMNTVLQCGLKLVFKRRSRDGSQPAEALEAVHGCVSRHVNPIGFTSYRVSGPQPAGVGSSCALQGWSVEGGCLVVEVASRQQQLHRQDSQDSAPAPARRLFGDCLPSPATIRKQRPQRDATVDEEEQPQAPMPVPQAHQQSEGRHSQQALLLRPASASAPTPAAPAATEAMLPQQPPQLEAMGSSTGAAAAGGAAPANGCCRLEPSNSFPSSDCSDALGSDSVPAYPNLSKSERQASRAALQSRDIDVATPSAPRPKRHRRCPTWHNADAEQPAPQPSFHVGIDLLLAAHLALTQQECGRPKRARRPNRLFVQ